MHFYYRNIKLLNHSQAIESSTSHQVIESLSRLQKPLIVEYQVVILLDPPQVIKLLSSQIAIRTSGYRGIELSSNYHPKVVK